MVGIIGAMDVEIEHIKEQMEDTIQEKVSGIVFYIGKINNIDIVLSKSFEGKVNSAMCTQTMILKYNPKIIINIGVAGAVSDKLNIFDIVIAQNTLEFDFDTTALGYELGYVFGIDKVYMGCSNRINDIVYKIAQKENNVLIGNIASSDKFVSDDETKSLLIREFEDVLAVDMESASVSHVCILNNVEFCSIRVISDNGNNMEFREFVEIAINKLDKVVLEVLENI